MLGSLTIPGSQHLPPDRPVPKPLPRLLSGGDLAIEDSLHQFERLVLGRLEPAEIAGMLIALRMKGETVEEMIGAARALSNAAQPFDRPDYLYADCCGTGGDGSGLINVSTATAFVAVACGLPIAKHGNRSVSSQCGSADVLEALGVKIEVDATKARTLLDRTGFCFLCAPAFHPGMKHAATVRRQLSVRTVMNLLGPCVNRARPPFQLLGVADPTKLNHLARVLHAMGVERALVVHGSGLDDVALHGPARAVRLDRGSFTEIEITPEAAGVKRAPLDLVTGGNPAENARRLRDLFGGGGSTAERDIVVLNCATLLMTAGIASDLRIGGDSLARHWRMGQRGESSINMSRRAMADAGGHNNLLSRAHGPLVGTVAAPGDKSISHRALILASMADGESRVEGLLESDDVLRTVDAIRAFGATAVREAPGRWAIQGAKWKSPSRPIYCGNAGTAVRLLMGVAAGFRLTATFDGDPSLQRRPMARVTEPLKRMGARVAGGPLLPVTISGGDLRGNSFNNPRPSAQVKSAVLLAGLKAVGPVEVIEPEPSRDHTEQMLRSFGADVEFDVVETGRSLLVRLATCEVLAWKYRVILHPPHSRWSLPCSHEIRT